MEKRADSSTQLEVDTDILDYLLYTAIKAVLEDRRKFRKRHGPSEEQRRADLPLQMVDSYLVIFHSLHPNQRVSASIEFRLRLLKFASLFTMRFVPCQAGVSLPTLQEMRRKHEERAKLFLSHQKTTENPDLAALATSLPLPAVTLQFHRQHILASLFSTQIPRNDYGSPHSLSLLDTLPEFIALSAAQNALQESTITDVWMKLAARYMAQAVLEQYLIFGAQGPTALQEAFAWGLDSNSDTKTGSDEWKINAMFWGGEDEELSGWNEIRDEHKNAFVPSPGTSLQTCLEALESNELSLVTFEDCLLDFLEGLLQGQSKPAIAQLEAGKVDGISRKDTRALKDTVGFR